MIKHESLLPLRVFALPGVIMVFTLPNFRELPIDNKSEFPKGKLVAGCTPASTSELDWVGRSFQGITALPPPPCSSILPPQAFNTYSKHRTGTQQVRDRMCEKISHFVKTENSLQRIHESARSILRLLLAGGVGVLYSVAVLLPNLIYVFFGRCERAPPGANFSARSLSRFLAFLVVKPLPF